MKRLVSAAVVALALGLSGAALAQGYNLTGSRSASKTVVGEDIVYPPGKAVITSAIVVLAPGERTIVHRHGVPMFAYMLEGELTVDYGATHGIKVYRQGDSLLEAMNVSHFGRNSGTSTVRILAVYMGAEGAKDVLAD